MSTSAAGDEEKRPRSLWVASSLEEGGTDEPNRKFSSTWGRREGRRVAHYKLQHVRRQGWIVIDRNTFVLDCFDSFNRPGVAGEQTLL